jgi:hypothetical protein
VSEKRSEKVFLKTFKKPLDKRKTLWYNNKVGRKELTTGKPYGCRGEKRNSKKLEKLFKNLLTNEKECGIICESQLRKAERQAMLRKRHRSLKIEQ